MFYFISLQLHINGPVWGFLAIFKKPTSIRLQISTTIKENLASHLKKTFEGSMLYMENNISFFQLTIKSIKVFLELTSFKLMSLKHREAFYFHIGEYAFGRPKRHYEVTFYLNNRL